MIRPYLLSTIAQAQSTDAVQPLIDQSGEDIIYVGVGIIAIILILALGALSENLEKSIIFALLFSLGLIFAVFVL